MATPRPALLAAVVAGHAGAIARHVLVPRRGVVVASVGGHAELARPDAVIGDVAAVAVVHAAARDEPALVVHPVLGLAVLAVAVQEDRELLLLLGEGRHATLTVIARVATGRTV